MKLFNSYTNKLEKFTPIKPGEVSIYVCGPTVYSYIHIGNARPVIFFDTVKKYFEHIGYTVKFVSNLTDVDDKIINKALALNTTEKKLSEKYIDAFLSDVEKVQSDTNYIKPKVTDYIDHIIEFIQTLIDKDYAYKKGGDVFFRVDKIKEYGYLSNRNIDDLRSGSRIEVNTKKENPLDFTLWKETDVGIKFLAPFGEGRPGWHTECVAMIDDVFGGKIDIHGGGSGLLFPHHENEIAQSLAVNNHSIANIWMHNGMLNIDDAKMSKSEGTTILVKDLDVNPNVFRLFTLSTHYRSPINYTDDVLENYAVEWEKTQQAYKQLYLKLDLLEKVNETVTLVAPFKGIYQSFKDAMEEDFNTPNGITALQELVKETNQLLRGRHTVEQLRSSLTVFKAIFTVFSLRPQITKLTDKDRKLHRDWQQARTDKDFKRADEIRDVLQGKGIL
ncbi:MAG: cysteine--tRNA ligase [Candidatus Izimaplasma sp.]|nr:cysteine--tRNA ligase [Candidatus Izimaplasma bacterium]